MRAGLGCALALTAALAGAARAADEELVKLFLSQGAALLEKNKPDEAAAKFRRAIAEDGTCVAGWGGLAQALEKKGDKAGAIEAYRGATDAHDGRRRQGDLRPEDEAAAEKAYVRLETLVPGEGELRRLRDTYLADLLALARECVDGDPAAAKKAVDAVLTVSPADADAKALAVKLGMSGAKTGPSGVKPSVKGFTKWDDLIGRTALSADTITVSDKGFVVHDAKDGGEVAWADPQPETSDEFVLELEVRLVKAYSLKWHAGWAFYAQGDRFLALVIDGGECRLVEHVTEFKDLEEADLPTAKDGGGWRRLALTVEKQRRLTATLDGKSMFVRTLPEDFEPGGRMGVWTQNAKVEYRLLRVGTP